MVQQYTVTVPGNGTSPRVRARQSRGPLVWHNTFALHPSLASARKREAPPWNRLCLSCNGCAHGCMARHRQQAAHWTRWKTATGSCPMRCGYCGACQGSGTSCPRVTTTSLGSTCSRPTPCTRVPYLWPAPMACTYGLHLWPAPMACTYGLHLWLWPAHMACTYGLLPLFWGW